MSNLIEKLTKEERFFQDVDGYYYFDHGKGQGAFMSHNLREIADELDRLNGEGRSKTKSDLEEERDEARAESTPLKKIHPDWMPIESAPEDGTEVLLYQPNAGIQVSWYGYDTDNEELGWYRFSPTHWMPLPYPPQSSI